MGMKYKIRNSGGVEDILHVESKISIPKYSGNRDYEQFLQDVKEQGISIVEGPDITTESYATLRQKEYPPMEDQLDKIYHSGVDAWKDDIRAIKDKYPKSQVGVTTVAAVPSWVQTEVDKLIS